MKDTLKLLVTSIVDQPDEVEVVETEEDGIINFSIKVAPDDMGKVIGKEGKVIRALRNAMKIPAIREGRKIQISLEDSASDTPEK